MTGSKYCVEFDGKRLLVDCGLFQGYKQLRLRNWNPMPTPAAHIGVGGHLWATDGFRRDIERFRDTAWPVFCARLFGSDSFTASLGGGLVSAASADGRETLR